MPRNLVLAKAALRVSLRETESEGSFDALVVSAADGNGNTVNAVLELAKPLQVPAQLLVAEGDELRLKQPKDIAANAEVAVRRELDAARERLREGFGKQHSIHIAASGERQASFFGLTAVGSAALQAHLTLSPKLLDASADLSAEVLVRAEASATITMVVNVDGAPGDGGGKADALLLAVLVGGAQAKVTIDARVPRLAGFDLNLPEFSLPKLRFEAIELLFKNWPSIGLGAVPALGALSVQWTSQPKLQVEVNEPASGELSLSLKTAPAGAATLKVGTSEILKLEDLKIEGADKIEVSAKLVVQKQDLPTDDVPDIPAGPFLVHLGRGKLEVEPIMAGPGVSTPVKLKAVLDQLLVSCIDDPKLSLPLHAEFEVEFGKGGPSTKLSKLKVREPFPLDLLVKALDQLAGAAVRIAGAIPLPSAPDVSAAALLERIGKMLAAAAEWLARQAGAAGRALVGVGESIRDALLELYRKLAGLSGKVPSTHVVIEVRLDATDWSLLQVCIMPASKDADLDAKDFASAFGFDFGYALRARPALVFDAKEEWLGIAMRTLDANKPIAVLATDLWLSRETAPAEPLTLLDEKTGGKGDTKLEQGNAADFLEPRRLLGVKVVSKKSGQEFVLVALQRGQVKLLQSFARGAQGKEVDLGDGKVSTLAGIGPLENLEWGELFDLEPHLNLEEIKKSVLNLFPKADPGKKDDGGFFDKLGQYVKVTGTEDPKIDVANRTFGLGIRVMVQLGKDLAPEITMKIAVDLNTLTARITGADRISLMKAEPYRFPLLGLNFELDRTGNGSDPYEALALDLSGGRQSFGLGKDAKAVVSYGAVATSGRGLVFDVPIFQVASNGLTLEAKIAPEPVVLGGVDVPFKFTSGGISVRQSKLLGGSLAGSGQLPRALIGEANANIALSLIAGEDGGIEVESAEARLDKSGDPIVCQGTRFRLDITELGMGFAKENAYHFYFLLTGSARFAPARGEAAEGLLKQLGNLEIQLKKAPLTSDPRVLMRSISFQVKCEPPKTGNFFDIFKFELRGIGFHPSTQAFGGDPAISVSGQVKFAFGDVISSRIDCHQLYIAAPKPPSNFPRVRFDGLTVGLQIGMASVEGTAIAVDEKLPELFSPKTLPANVTAKGFLAAGRIELKGWAPMSASMGFLELRDKVRDSSPKHAFYFYSQKNKLAEQIPTPIGTFYLREVGFGFGYRYTLAGIAQAERATSPKEMIRILDEVSKYQGSLDSIRAWEPTYDNDGLTLAMRALFTVAAASSSDQYNAQAEKELPNPLLFDVIAAIRSDLTFLMNVRSWVAVNYADWVDAGENAALKSNPTQRGYLYLSAPRQEFLGRFIADGKGHVGDHPPLPDPLKKAIEQTRFSATLYLRPGLFHFELGWPFELGMHMGDPNGDFFLACSGGLIHRIEDGGMLMGIAFRGAGHARFSGRVGGDSLGASASASATFALEAKALAYLSLRSKEGSMLYGSFQLNVTVAVAVAVWLRFKVWRYTVSLSAGFSLSLSLSVAVELVLLEGAGIGGRAHVAIGVQAFGRSLSLGIGFTFGPNVLDLARARVARFMDLGLTVDTPTAESLPASEKRPQLEASRGDRATQADSRTDSEAAQAPSLPPAPDASQEEEKEPRYPGRTIAATHFWALVFPTTDAKRPGEKLYVVQLVPRDHTAVKGIPTDKDASTFYASPRVKQHPEHVLEPLPEAEFDHEVTFTASPAGTMRFGADGQPGDNVVQGANSTQMLRGAQVIAPQPGTPGISLGELLTELFMGPDGDASDAMTEPRGWANDAKRDALQGDAQAKALRLEKAGRERRNLTAAPRQEAEVEERRSAVLGAVVETAAALAARGANDKGEWPEIPEGQLECRHFGLTFLMDQAAIKSVFGDGDAQSPPLGELFVRKRDAKARGNVYLFNPPRRHFRERAPRLAGLTVDRNASGVTLNWDLEPAWGESQGAYDDPEFHLAHYTIVRRITGLREGDWQASFRVKGAAPMEFVDEKDGRRQKFMRPEMQFVDDFSQPPGIPEPLRHMLMGLHVSDAHQLWTEHSNYNDVRIEYLIVPVDIAGTSDVGTPVEYRIPRPKPLLKTPLQARLQVRYDAVPVLGWSPAGAPIGVQEGKNTPYVDGGPAIRLSMTADADRNAAGQPADPDATFLLKIRPERVIPGGLFGDEALASALARPSAEEIDQDRPGDQLFVLRMARGEPDPAKSRLPLEVLLPGGPAFDPWHFAVESCENSKPTGKPAAAALLEALGLVGEVEPRTVRAFLRRQSFLPCDEPLPRAGPVHGSWRVMELGVEIRGTQRGRAGELLLAHEKAPTPVDATLDSFEALRGIEFEALHRADMHVESGRLHLVKPAPASDLQDLYIVNTQPVRTVSDVKRRAATRLKWRAQPRRLAAASGAVAEPLLRSLVGGFDLFAMDADLLPDGFTVADAASDPSRYVQPLGRVMMLPASMRGLAPTGFGDLGRIEAAYPSETCRIDNAAKASMSESRPRLAPWFSPAESVAVFPRPMLRKSVFPAPDEALVATLMAQGQPDAIRSHVTGWPALASIPRPTVTYFTEGTSDKIDQVFRNEAWTNKGLEAAELTLTHIEPDGKPRRFTAALVRHLLQSLQLQYERGADWEAAVRANPDVFAGVRIVVEAMRKVPGKPDALLASETYEFTPLTRVHPVLADALEFVRYDDQVREAKQPGAVYRRFEVVPDADPQTNATRFAAWQDETPPQRDPYGWGGLRMLGLATGFRLYDTEEGSYVLGKELLERVHMALARAVARYCDAAEGELGAPFADLVSRPWGNAKLFSFDGGHRDPTTEEIDNMIDNELLATVQVALRPVPGGFVAKGRHRFRPVTYHRFSIDAAAETLRFSVKENANATKRFYDLVEVGTLVQPRAVRIDGKSPPLVLPLQPAAKRREFLVRVLSMPGTEGAWIDDVTITPQYVNEPEIRLPAAAATKAATGTDPFGIFDDLTSADWARLLVLKDEKDDVEGYRLGAVLDRLDFYAARRFGPAEVLKDLADAEDHVRRNVAFWRTYLEHSDSKAAGERIAFSLGTLADPGTWRVPVAADGSMSIVSVEAERFGSRRRYAVRPFGRFEQLAAAIPTASVAGKVYEYRAPQGLERGLPVDVKAWNERFADATLPRTEPVAKPVILAATRLEAERCLELVVAHTADQVLAQANRGTQARVAQHGIGVGLWREFPHRAWARALVPDADALAEFGSLEAEIPREELELSIARDGGLKQLRERVPDAWMGSWVVRARKLPYFFRVHALVHATAGVMVSEQTGATFAEGFSRLQLPWAPGHHQKPPCAPPRYTVARDEDARRLSITFRFATVRLIDCMEEEDVKLWFSAPGDGIRQVIRLPEPGAGYRIVLQAARDTGEVLAWQPEIEVLPSPPKDPTAQSNVYLVQQTGERLFVGADGGKPLAIRPLAPAVGQEHWHVELGARIGKAPAQAAVPEADEWTVEAADAARHIVFNEDAAALGKWMEGAPRGVLHVTFAKPAADGWKTFESSAAMLLQEVAKWHDKLGVLGSAVDLLENLVRIASADGEQDVQWKEHFKNEDAMQHVGLEDWVVGVPPLLVPLGRARTVEDSGSAVRANVLSSMAHLDQQEGTVLRAFLHRRMRRLRAAQLRVDESPYDGIAPLVHPLQGDDKELGSLVEALKDDGLRQTFGVLYPPVPLTLPAAAPALEDLERVLAILEKRPGGGDAIATLLAWADAPKALPVAFALPMKLDGALAGALAALGAKDIGNQTREPAALVLWRPPLDTEIDALGPSSARMARLAQAQLFGAGKRPALLVTRDAELPLDTVFERKAEGGRHG